MSIFILRIFYLILAQKNKDCLIFRGHSMLNKEHFWRDDGWSYFVIVIDQVLSVRSKGYIDTNFGFETNVLKIGNYLEYSRNF